MMEKRQYGMAFKREAIRLQERDILIKPVGIFSKDIQR